MASRASIWWVAAGLGLLSCDSSGSSGEDGGAGDGGPDGSGGAVACSADADCGGDQCFLGICAAACSGDSTCDGDLVCSEVADISLGATVTSDECDETKLPEATTELCLPTGSTLTWNVGAVPDGFGLLLALPSHAAAFTLVAEIDDDDEVGFATLIGPTGILNETPPLNYDEFVAQPIWYVTDDYVSTLLVPNTPDIGWQPGAHCATVATDGAADPDVTAYVKLGTDIDDSDDFAGRISFHFYFLDLSEVSCELSTLDAASAESHAEMVDAVADIETVFEGAGIAVTSVQYDDVAAPALEVLDPDDDAALVELAALATKSEGFEIDVFIVRELTGSLGVSGAIPGPPERHGVPHSAVVISAEGACDNAGYFGRLIAHEVAHQLGLFHVIEPNEYQDNIADTDPGDSDNLMSPSVGFDLTPGQSFVLRRHPSVLWPQ